jgi:hypothetical protein
MPPILMGALSFPESGEDEDPHADNRVREATVARLRAVVRYLIFLFFLRALDH